jgi:hypothetical protein
MDELSDTKIRNATPADKEYAIADGQGLSVVVRPNGCACRKSNPDILVV